MTLALAAIAILGLWVLWLAWAVLSLRRDLDRAAGERAAIRARIGAAHRRIDEVLMGRAGVPERDTPTVN